MNKQEWLKQEVGNNKSRCAEFDDFNIINHDFMGLLVVIGERKIKINEFIKMASIAEKYKEME